MLCKHLIFPALFSVGLGFFLFGCGLGDETIQVPTEGLITTVTEVSPDDYKIASEESVDLVEDSRIIVEKMSGARDTFTLEQAKLITQVSSDTSAVSRPFHRAGMGYFGFLMLGRMGGHSVNSGAYVNNGAYNKASNTAGSRLTNSARSTTRSRSGFGGGKSTRSFGG
ncbi:hypothetical protein [Neolewinella persica]|uniref:hypothetical protein n=1 Tax=Neolewinella persica TaxID=70998 RepID=UPI00036E9DAB|nr:hypothetical protein [Neolewinella persica]